MTTSINSAFASFQTGSSLLHRLDPRAKLVSIGVALVAVVLADSWLGVGLLALFALFGAGLGGAGIGTMARDLWTFRFFYLLTILIHLLLDRSGKVVFEFFNLFNITSDGIEAGFFFSAKIALLASLGGALTRTTHPVEWSRGVEGIFPSHGRMGRFFGRPGLVLGLALRTLPTILSEAERIRLAQAARGLRIGEGGIIKRTKNLFPVVGPLLNATLRKGDTLVAAMTSRGFRLDGVRTDYRPLKMTLPDWAVLLLSLSLLVCTLTIDS